jgi:hypothetical protein
MSAVKRLLDANAGELLAMSGAELAESILLSEGRTVAVEVLCDTTPPVEGVSHGELAAAFGADVIGLDHYDPLQPFIAGAPQAETQPLRAYAHLVGRPVGINLIVVDDAAQAVLGGRAFTESHAERAAEQGAQFLFVYVRPEQGGTHAEMARRISSVSRQLGDRVLLAGVPSFSRAAPRNSESLNSFQADLRMLVDAGCLGAALPMPGSKQGWTLDAAAALIDTIHEAGALAWLFVTHSVEGAQPDVMTALALDAKRLGADAVRLDEAGLSGMPLPENILNFSLALRGARHTYRRMAASVLR